MPSVSIDPDRSSDTKVAVISHERSGTHFLMNTIANNFNYCASPWWNLDFHEGLNFYSSSAIRDYLSPVDDKCVLNILKSHHPFTFFEDIIDYLTSQFYVFYIYRHPADVMLSNWKLIKTYDWPEGPKTKTLSEFIRSEPCGAMMRYQMQQEKTVLHRWATHVSGWTEAASRFPDRIFTIRYEDLNQDFDTAVNNISSFLNMKTEKIYRPSVNENVVGKGKGIVFAYREYFSEEDRTFMKTAIGDALDKHGYQV